MDISKLVERMRSNPSGVRFGDVVRCAEHYFGKPRVHGSHHVFKMPWAGDPRVNVQDKNGIVAEYQVRQLLRSIDRWEAEHD